ncbi:3499_t:CDS:2 [Entrophospora sp. SA101]|nr:3499_t:CDS:2 [Entrophospora sp. SA101]
MPIDPYMKNPHKSEGCCQEITRLRGWGYPDICRVKGSVLPSCFPIIFFSTVIATIVAVLYEVLDIDVTLPGSIIGSVSVVVGLLLAFRTNNAYDRYYEGRKLFTNMCTHIRNATRILWVGVVERNDNGQDHKEKVKNIKLLLAFAVATKHHLRLEFGTEWFDLQDLLPEGFQFTFFDGNAGQENTDVSEGDPENPNRPENANSSVSTLNRSHRSLLTRIPPTVYASLRNSISASESTLWFGDDWGEDVDASMSLPLEIIFHINLYIDAKIQEGTIDGNRFGTVSGSLNSLVDILGSLERISNTPIPFAYNVHLKQAVTIYVWVLPFTMVSTLGWLVIPVVMVIAFILFGVETIGAEIENPFGYDKNDLPLDEYCKDLEAEVKYLQRHLPSKKLQTLQLTT